jgi:hypothetical protein
MGSRERPWEIFGPAWGWPQDTTTLEEDRADLRLHEEEIAAHQSFNYGRTPARTRSSRWRP